MRFGIVDRRILIALILVMFGANFLWDLTSFIPPVRIQESLDDSGSLAPLFYMAVLVLAVVIPLIPTLPLDIAAGAFFGPFLETIYSALGATAGAAIAFLLARYLGREIIDRFLSGHVNFCTQCSDRLLTKVVAISRLLPFISFRVVSYGAGLTMMSLRAFSLATFFGMLPMTVVYNYFGSALWAARRGTVLSLGIVMVLFLFIFSRLVKKYDFLSLRSLLQHKEKETASQEKRSLENQ